MPPGSQPLSVCVTSLSSSSLYIPPVVMVSACTTLCHQYSSAFWPGVLGLPAESSPHWLFANRHAVNAQRSTAQRLNRPDVVAEWQRSHPPDCAVPTQSGPITSCRNLLPAAATGTSGYARVPSRSMDWSNHSCYDISQTPLGQLYGARCPT